jgi:hypothetical protein
MSDHWQQMNAITTKKKYGKIIKGADCIAQFNLEIQVTGRGTKLCTSDECHML